MDEFTEPQRRAYLGRDASGGDRYDRIPEEAREILGVPRVLEYLRRLPDEQWGSIRTVTDVYWLSIRRLVEGGLNNSTEARRIGLLRGEAIPSKASAWQVLRALDFLGAMAFEMTTMTARKSTDGPTEDPNFDRVSPGQIGWFCYRMMCRLKRKRLKEISERDKRFFRHDFDCLAAMNDMLSQGLLDVARESVGGLNQVLWRNRTLQEFFAAYWLANHCTRKQADQLWHWIDRPAEPLSSEYYWVWRFLTEMPDEAIGRTDGWIRSIAPLYRPGSGRAEETKRSSEMIYRSWQRLEKYAEQGKSVAVEVRDEFLGEFQRILSGQWEHNAQEGQRRAKELVDSLIHVPAGRFRMGVPEEKQPVNWRNVTPDDAYREPRVEAFLLSHSPTINAWYWLYDPGHGPQYRLYQQLSNSMESPVLKVSWYDAWTFCLWARWDSRSCRLPQEHEWEYAAKAGTPWDWNYWWGEELDPNKCLTGVWLQFFQERTPLVPSQRAQTHGDLGTFWEAFGSGASTPTTSITRRWHQRRGQTEFNAGVVGTVGQTPRHESPSAHGGHTPIPTERSPSRV